MHQVAETDPWKINVPDHAAREDTPGFRAAKQLAHDILDALHGCPYGPGPWQMHHGGSLWTMDAEGVWFLVLNIVGVEWSAQFCCDPAKLDLVRQNAQRHYAGFPHSIPAMVELGYDDAQEILETPITDAATISRYVDSVFNSCVPLAAQFHTGVLGPAKPWGGQHHYPKPVTDIQHLKHDDFNLWVVTADGWPAAVAPVAPRGAGEGHVRVLYATPGTQVAEKHRRAHARGHPLILGPNSPLARQAFVRQR